LSDALETADLQRLVWRCRRGMKELDLILGAWLRNSWAGAAADERAEFERFLELPDPVIAGYLLGRDAPENPETLALVGQLRGQASR
jgi:antitoxin CptB